MFERFGIDVDKRVVFSTLWIFLLFNLIFRDIHELFRPGMMAEMVAMNVSEELMLVGGLMIEVIIVMIPLSRLAGYRVVRWGNIVVGLYAMASIGMNNTSPDLDDLFFAVVEGLTLVYIIWTAWRWREPEMDRGKLVEAVI